MFNVNIHYSDWNSCAFLTILVFINKNIIFCLVTRSLLLPLFYRTERNFPSGIYFGYFSGNNFIIFLLLTKFESFLFKIV